MNRALAPEWLDELPASDTRALASRRDLRRLNSLMGSHRVAQRALVQCFPSEPPRVLAELGAGDGDFFARTVGLLACRWPRGHAVLVDRIQPSEARRRAVRDALNGFGWSAEFVQADVFDYLQEAEADAVIANLFLHHFEAGRLAALFALLSIKSKALVACEPRRARLPYNLSRLLGLVGCNDVTRHDAPISVRAGFRARELSALWPKSGWRLDERRAGWLNHLFVARRMP